jgi:hypothetical protein
MKHRDEKEISGQEKSGNYSRSERKKNAGE